MTHRLVSALVSSLAVLALVASAGAQASRSPYLSVSQTGAFLLGNPLVQKELKLTPAKSGDLQKEFASYDKDREAIASKTTPNSTKEQLDLSDLQLQQLDQQFSSGIVKSLASAQSSRLLQLSYQALGPAALQWPESAKELGLTPDQVGKVRDLLVAFDKRNEDVQALIGAKIEQLPDPKPGDKDSADKYREAVKKIMAEYQPQQEAVAKGKIETDVKIIALLTTEQARKWAALQGEKFAFEPRAGG